MTPRFLIAALALIGVIVSVQLVGAQLATGDACPRLGPVPACYLVLGAYLLIFASNMLTGWTRTALFLLAWLPVFALALVASAFDLLAGPVCPRALGAVPQCFVSLALAGAIGWVWIVGQRGWQRTKPFRRQSR